MISFWQTTCHHPPGPGLRWKLPLIALPCRKRTLDSRTRHAFQAWAVSMGYPFGSLTCVGMVTGPNVAQGNLVQGFCWNCGEKQSSCLVSRGCLQSTVSCERETEQEKAKTREGYNTIYFTCQLDFPVMLANKAFILCFPLSLEKL